MTDELIVKVAAKGDGVTADGRHVRLAAPGDLVAIDGAVKPGPHHVNPPCRHFPACGGCQLQHIDDAAYAAFLHDRIVDALHAQRLDAPEMRPAHLSPPRSRRRVSLRAERMGNRVVLGFNEGASHRIIDMRQCEIMAPALFALIAPLRTLLATLMPNRRAAGVQMTLTDQSVDLAIEKIEIEGLEATERLTNFARENKLARLSIDQGYGTEARWEPDAVTVMLSGVPVPFPVGAFLQATADGEEALVQTMRAAVGTPEITADLFAGLGTFSLALEGKVLAVEGARDAVLALKAAVGRTQRPIAVEHRDLFRRPLSTEELNRFDAIILDPPRAGAREQTHEIARSGVERVAYVSCSPSTFARDARTLIEGGYRLSWIQPVGQFRWSTHAELVASFSRSSDI